MAELLGFIGRMSIAESRNDEFNTYVLKLLDLCGIRKLKQANVGENEVTVASKVEPDVDGMVSFDYSIFEMKRVDGCSYDMNNCELTLGDCGLNEFGMAMMLLMTMQESYSSTRCYLTLKGEIVPVNNKALVIEDILGIRLRFPYRADTWGMYMFLKESGYRPDSYTKDALGWCPEDFEDDNSDQWFEIAIWERERGIKEELKEVEIRRDSIKESGIIRNNILYSIYLKLGEEKESIKQYLKRLISLNYPERKKLSEEDSDFGLVAEASLFACAACMVRILARACSEDFWKLWAELATDKVYIDNRPHREVPRIKKTYSFYEGILRDNEDVFLGVWPGRELLLSNSMKEAISVWREIYSSITTPSGFKMEKELYSVIRDLKEDWKVPVPAESMVRDMLDNSDIPENIKAICLLRQVMDRYIGFFPELTRKDAKLWVFSTCIEKFDHEEIFALMGVLSDKETRHSVIGL